MNRRSGFGLSMLVMSLWMGQTALTELGVFSLVWGAGSVTLAGFGGGILSGLFEPEAIPDEEMDTLESRIILLMISIGLVASLLIFLTSYV